MSVLTVGSATSDLYRSTFSEWNRRNAKPGMAIKFNAAAEAFESVRRKLMHKGLISDFTGSSEFVTYWDAIATYDIGLIFGDWLEEHADADAQALCQPWRESLSRLVELWKEAGDQ